MGVLGSIAGGLAAGAATSLLSGDAPDIPRAPLPEISAGGLRTSVNRRGQLARFGVTATPERMGLINQLRGLRAARANQIRGLLPQVRPGFGRLTQAGEETFASARQKLEARRRRTVGNLRENLQRRRVLGSSFASDALARASAEFETEERALAADEAMFKAENFLRELDTTFNLQAQAFNQDIQAIQTLIGEQNLQADVALQLATGVQSTLSQNAALQARLAILSAQGRGQAVEQFFGPALNEISQSIQQAVQNAFQPSPAQALAAGTAPV